MKGNIHRASLLADSELLVEIPGEVVTCPLRKPAGQEMMESGYVSPGSGTRELFDSTYWRVGCESIDTIPTEIHLIEAAVFVGQLGTLPARSLTDFAAHISDRGYDVSPMTTRVGMGLIVAVKVHSEEHHGEESQE